MIKSNKIIRNIPGHVTSILDAGFGAGVYSFTLAGRVGNIDAIDVDGKKADYAKKMKSNLFRNIRFQIMDLTDLTFSDCSFDVIICSDVLEHIKEDERAIYHLARVLKKVEPYLLQSHMILKRTGQRINSIIMSGLDTRNQKYEGYV
jgi:2-polyprenyl-3-methyl-5-hydroxy-6-metoxy-1,4-benzoquinol methylase